MGAGMTVAGYRVAAATSSVAGPPDGTATLPAMPVSKGRKKATRRPTPPRTVDPVKSKGPSPKWYIVTMFGLMGLGMVIILANYIGLLPGGTSNNYLFAGLAAIAVGFGMTLNFR
jgi:hypothetical protein